MAKYAFLPACRLLINGQENSKLSVKILAVEVTLQLNSVDEISITLTDVADFNDGTTFRDVEGLQLYDQLRVEFGYINALDSIIEGELTAVEASFPNDGNATLRLQGHSPLHKLLRERRTRTFTQVKDGEIVSQIARDHGLGVSVGATNVLHDYVIQANRTDLDFLLERAAALNFDLWFEDGSVVFRPARTTEAEIGSLAWGQGLLSFSPRLDGRTEIRKVTVLGYDPKEKAAVSGSWQGSKGVRVETLGDPTVSTKAKAQGLAEAIGAEAKGRRVTGSASTIGNPRIRPGRPIDLRGIGPRFSGRYKITRATHRYGSDGYRTDFDVQGEGPR
jgi:uncharacterized protein